MDAAAPTYAEVSTTEAPVGPINGFIRHAPSGLSARQRFDQQNYNQNALYRAINAPKAGK